MKCLRVCVYKKEREREEMVKSTMMQKIIVRYLKQKIINADCVTENN